MVQSWKDCVGAIPPGVRIPPSPVLIKLKEAYGGLLQ